jgi:hypothetical protein
MGFPEMDGKPQMDGTPQTKINDLWVPIFFGSPHIPTPKHQVFHVSNGSKTINLKRLGPIGLDLVSITTELLHCSGPFSLLGIGTLKKSTGKLKFFDPQHKWAMG